MTREKRVCRGQDHPGMFLPIFGAERCIVSPASDNSSENRRQEKLYRYALMGGATLDRTQEQWQGFRAHASAGEELLPADKGGRHAIKDVFGVRLMLHQSAQGKL